MIIEIDFHGDLADSHQLPGITGASSIEGLARALTMISHYAVTGEIRHRYPFSEEFHLNLLAFEEGSFRTKLQLSFGRQACIWILGATASGTIGNFTYDLLKSTLNATVGKSAATENPLTQDLRGIRPGDLEALQEAITPSAKKAHTIVGNGAQSIVIIGNNNNIVTFDSRTKDYLNNLSMGPDLHIKLASVGMLNANSRNARIFDYEHGRLISAYVVTDCEPRTMPNLATSLQRYTRAREASKLYIKYRRQDLPSRPSKYFILDAWFED